MFVFGNTLEEDSVKFYKDQILPNFKIVKHYGAIRDHLYAGCMYTETSKKLDKITSTRPSLLKKGTSLEYD